MNTLGNAFTIKVRPKNQSIITQDMLKMRWRKKILQYEGYLKIC